MLTREWSRGPQWASTSDRASWEATLRSAQQAWDELEVISITEGLRNSALVFLTPAELVQAVRDTVRAGLEVTVLDSSKDSLRAAVHRPGMREVWLEAWASSDDDTIGQLLNFPRCCRDFFRREWVERGARDVVPAMRTVDGPWEANILLRWMGVRLVPHLPCSGDCAATVTQAQAYASVGARLGLDILSIERILKLPVVRTATNGLAVYETPHFRFMVAIDPTDAVSCARQAGVSGVSLETSAAWKDNGFSSEESMKSAHAVILHAVQKATTPLDSALDLGSGNGELLARIADGRPGRWIGIEADPARAARHVPGVDVWHGSIESLSWAGAQYDVVLLMPGRILEMSSEDAARVRSALRGRRLVLYSYGAWLGNRGLIELCAKTGFQVTGGLVSSVGSEAVEARVA